MTLEILETSVASLQGVIIKNECDRIILKALRGFCSAADASILVGLKYFSVIPSQPLHFGARANETIRMWIQPQLPREIFQVYTSLRVRMGRNMGQRQRTGPMKVDVAVVLNSPPRHSVKNGQEAVEAKDQGKISNFAPVCAEKNLDFRSSALVTVTVSWMINL